jgi:demethylmenaquinone methyltransferase/2-methoxy-6-polyprenyl-1,4-benzoquinol methylase
MVCGMAADSRPPVGPAAAPERVPFGRRDVDPADKPMLVRAVFDSVAARYDLMNDLMSGGVHRLWKRAMVAALEPRAGARVLDLAGGTGDIASRILDRYGEHGRFEVTVCDLTPAMLREGRRRAWDAGRVADLRWACGDAEALPFIDRAFDACTVAFGMRNVARLDRALGEIARVLGPGGRFLCLEFSPRVAPGLAALYDVLSFRVIPALGEAVTGDRAAYEYLVESIRRFPPPERFTEMIEAEGFAGVRARAFSGGVAVLHTAWRV